MNGNIFNPVCQTIEGVVEAYKNTIVNVKLAGPTHFSSIISLVNDMTESVKITQANQKYTILLIITDGVINDMSKTVDEVVRGSSLPISIIIVGVGSADFKAMDELDADTVPLYSKFYNKSMAADIVQFVPFREYA